MQRPLVRDTRHCGGIVSCDQEIKVVFRPLPFDRISYTIFKKWPSLQHALLDLFNRVIMEGKVPSCWKVAAVKLIPKCSAQDNLSSPANFRIDTSLVTRQQKLRLYKQGVCPRLSWALLVDEFSITWLERDLQPLATRFLKKWTGLTRSANTSIFSDYILMGDTRSALVQGGLCLSLSSLSLSASLLSRRC